MYHLHLARSGASLPVSRCLDAPLSMSLSESLCHKAYRDSLRLYPSSVTNSPRELECHKATKCRPYFDDAKTPFIMFTLDKASAGFTSVVYESYPIVQSTASVPASRSQ